jgi:hypothetical protein
MDGESPDDARRFVFSSDRRPLGFDWLCDHLGLDADKIRKMCMTRTGRRRLRGKTPKAA